MAKEKQARSPIILNHARCRFVAPLRIPGSEKLAAFDMKHVDPGLNKPIDAELWARIREDKAVAKAIDEETIEELDSVNDIAPMSVDQVLKNCALVDSVRWWSRVERRAKVKEKVDAWIAGMEKKFERNKEALQSSVNVGVA